MFFSRKKLLISVVILICSFFISLLLVLVHIILTVNITSAIFGLTLLTSSIITYFYNQNIAKNKSKLTLINRVQVIPSNERTVETTVETRVHRTVNTNGSPYNENIEGDFIGRDSIETTIRRKVDIGSGIYNESIAGDLIGRDSVTKNIKNITVGNREVEINPNDIFETFDEFRDILAQSIAQSSNALEAISEFVKELTEQLCNHPEVKVCFGVDENISVQELVNKIFVDLLTQTSNQINEINQSNSIIQPDLIQKINISRSSVFIEHFEAGENNQHNFVYKGYTVNLSYKSSKGWRYKIKRSDSSINPSKTKYSRNVYFAIGRAVDQIDDEIDTSLQNSYEL